MNLQLFFKSSSNNNDLNITGIAIFLFFFGIWLFYKGFKALKKKRLIEDIPTSKVRGLAMGLVELYGKIKGITNSKSPFTNTKCVMYSCLIEEYKKKGKSSAWVTILREDNLINPFFLEDQTGKIMVMPKGAALIWPSDYEFKTGIGKTIPDKIVNFMDMNNVSYKSWFLSKKLRFREWYITQDEPIFVLGTAKRINDQTVDNKNELINRIRELKKDSERMKEVDLNKDKIISDDEWTRAVEKIGRELLEEKLASKEEKEENVIISKGDADSTLIISDYSQRDLISKISSNAVYSIFSGAIMSILSFTFLMFKHGSLIF